jgi:UDP-glucose 4-epimerase
MKKLLCIGGTGSLGKTLLKDLINDYDISVFSRDEAKHVTIKQLYPSVHSYIGDVRDRDALTNAILKIKPDIIINAAALKNVPEVEEVPMEGVKTNLLGTDNLIHAAQYYSMFSNTSTRVLSISTDKATKPVNAYGMAKALQERVHLRANSESLICNAVRYGNVLESRGSLIPLLKQRLQNNQEVYITHPEMTRFFLTLNESVELIKTALEDTIIGGQIFIPIIKSAKIIDIMEIFCEVYGKDKSLIKNTNIRPGEKIHESLISVEEARRTHKQKNTYIINDILSPFEYDDIIEEYSSGDKNVLMTKEELYNFLLKNGIFDV